MLRALNEWILENNCTPHVVVDAGVDGVQVPEEHIKNGQIVLNINPTAVRGLEINNRALSFEARFSGLSQQIFVPIEAVTAVYAKENGQGMVFGWDNEPSGPDTPSDDGKTQSKTKKPNLKVIK